MKAGLRACLPRVEARRRMREPITAMSPDAWWDTVLLATGDEDLAQQFFNAAVKAGWAARAEPARRAGG